jgi:hypothetical protein
VHNAIELALLVLPTPREWNKYATSIGERTNGSTGSVSCVEQGTIKGDSSDHAAEHQQIGFACLKCCSITC